MTRSKGTDGDGLLLLLLLLMDWIERLKEKALSSSSLSYFALWVPHLILHFLFLSCPHSLLNPWFNWRKGIAPSLLPALSSVQTDGHPLSTRFRCSAFSLYPSVPSLFSQHIESQADRQDHGIFSHTLPSHQVLSSCSSFFDFEKDDEEFSESQKSQDTRSEKDGQQKLT